MKHRRHNGLLLFTWVFFGLGLSSCQWENHYSDKAFLSYKFKLESCADIHGQDPYKEIWFSDYRGDYYSDLFDLSFEHSYLDFKAEMIDNHTIGKGYLFLTWKDGGVFEDRQFDYWSTAISNNFGGDVYAPDVPIVFGKWVYSISWCHLYFQFVVPDTREVITPTFHFRGGQENPAPSEF